MEVVAAVAASVPAVLLLAEKVSKHLAGRGNPEAKESVEELKSTLSTFLEYLSHNREEGQQAQGRELTEDFVNKIRDLTFEIEDALDEFMFHVPLHFHSTKFTKYLHGGKYFFKSRDAARRLSTRREGIQEKTKSIADLYKCLIGVAAPGSGNMTGNIPLMQSFEGDEMVGFKTRRKDLIKQLIQESSMRTTIQVVGPGGSGKTFLVNNVYRDAEIKGHFSCKAWIDVSRNFKGTEDLLAEMMLKEFCSKRVVEQILDQQPGSTGGKLHRYLKHERYLIVLDNVWSKYDYKNLVHFLPDGSRGSRIILTTRNFNVDERADHTHKLDGLKEKEALELFSKKAFPKRRGNNTYPEDWKELSMQIIHKCDRLPLAISAAGSLLSKKRPIKTEWTRFCDNIGSEIRTHDSILFNRVLKPSFVDLPNHLRSCFFYFSIFPEGHSIERGRLVRSWIGEGFVKEVSGKTLEEVAETYLNELIARCLVRESTTEIDGRVRSCNVLRLHHEFLVQLYGNKENFVTVIDKRDQSSSVRKVRRLSVHHDNIVTELSKIKNPSHVRTLFAFGHKDVSQKHSTIPSVLRKQIPGTIENQMENMLHKFRLLKVLDLQGMPLNYFPKDMSSFVLLRCLNLRHTNIKTVPRSIKKLSLLEILDLKYTLVTELPDFIYKLHRLSHLLVSFRGSQEYRSSGEAQGVRVYKGIKALAKSLHKMSLINVRNHREFIEELGKLTQLRKLGLADLKRESGVDVLRSIEKMKNLAKLDVRAQEDEYLNLDADMSNPHEHIQHLFLKGRLASLPSWISSRSLPSLVKVVLEGSKLNADQHVVLEALGALRSVTELKMIDYYTGERLVFKAQTFMKLKKLHVEKFEQLIEVSLENEALSALEELTICHCKKLKPLPRSCRLGQLKEWVVYEMSADFFSDVQRRIYAGELVDHIQTIDRSSSPGSGIREIMSRRYHS